VGLAVLRIADQWPSARRQVDADLMHATGVEATAQQRKIDAMPR
jgi:hypothetical protein